MSTLKQTMLTGVFWSAVEKYSAFFYIAYYLSDIGSYIESFGVWRCNGCICYHRFFRFIRLYGYRSCYYTV